MAYIGNIHGPRESVIIDRLGADFFGISPDALETDIEHHRFAESRNEVIPVHLDSKLQPYIVLSGPRIGEINFFLREHGYELSGKVLVTDKKGEVSSKRI